MCIVLPLNHILKALFGLSALALKALDQRTATTTSVPKDSVVQPTQAVSPPSPTSDAGRFHSHDRHRTVSDVGDGLTDSDVKGKVKEET